MSTSLFITGTNTHIGKTYVSCSLAESARKAGLAVGALKPFVSGGISDIEFLKRAMGEERNPYEMYFFYGNRPLTPAVTLGLRKEGASAVEKIFERSRLALRDLQPKRDVILVEGAGGVLAPLGGPYFVVDLMAHLGLPTWIVADAGLGTLNHTLLTVEALTRRNVPIRRILLNKARGQDLSEKTNPRLLQKITKIPVTLIPYGNTRPRMKKANRLLWESFQADFLK